MMHSLSATADAHKTAPNLPQADSGPPSNVVAFPASATVARRPVFFGGDATEHATSEPAASPTAFKITTAANSYAKQWTEKEATLDQLLELIAERDVRESKEGFCFTPSTLLGGKRNARSVDEVSMLVYDVDGKQTVDQVVAIIEGLGCQAYLYTSHSHMTTRTDVIVDDYERFAKREKQPLTPTVDSMRAYLKSKHKDYLQNIVFDANQYERVADKGNVYFLKHDPVHKCRVIFPLATPIKISKLAASNTVALEHYVSIYEGVGNALKLDYDPTCSDPCRLFYMPSAPPHMAEHIDQRVVEGPLLDYRNFARAEVKSGAKTADGSSSTVSGKTDGDKKPPLIVDGFNFRDYKPNHPGGDFDVEGFVETHLPDEIIGPRPNGGYTIHCPFEAEHTTPGGQGTFCANGDDKHGWTIFCSHASCQDAERKRMDFVAEWVSNDKVSRADVEAHSGHKFKRAVDAKVSADEIDAYLATLSNKSTEAGIQHAVEMLACMEEDIARASGLKRLKDVAPKSIDEKTLDAALNTERKKRETLIKGLKAGRAKARADQEKEKLDALSDDLTARFKYILQSGSYWDAKAGDLKPVDSVHRYALSIIEDKGLECTPPEALLLNTESKFDRIGYYPGKGEIYEDASGLRCLNVYKPSALQPKEGDALPMVDHIRYIFSNANTDAPIKYDTAECNYFCDLIAYHVQNPGTKILVGALIGSVPGTGKGTIARVMKEIDGAHNTVSPQFAELVGEKHEYLERKTLVAVPEVYDKDKTQVANNLKPIISEPTVRIKRNYHDHYEIENVAFWLMMTNHYNALFVENGDRRYFMYESQAQPHDPEYYIALHQWIDDGGAAYFYRWLLDRDVRHINPNAPALMTTTKQAAIEASKGEAMVEMEELFADGAAPFNVELFRLKGMLEHLRSKLDLKVSRPQLIAFLKARGAEPLVDSTVKVRLDVKGKLVLHEMRLWALRDAAFWRGATPEQRGEGFQHKRTAGDLKAEDSAPTVH